MHPNAFEVATDSICPFLGIPIEAKGAICWNKPARLGSPPAFLFLFQRCKSMVSACFATHQRIHQKISEPLFPRLQLKWRNSQHHPPPFKKIVYLCRDTYMYNTSKLKSTQISCGPYTPTKVVSNSEDCRKERCMTMVADSFGISKSAAGHVLQINHLGVCVSIEKSLYSRLFAPPRKVTELNLVFHWFLHHMRNCKVCTRQDAWSCSWFLRVITCCYICLWLLVRRERQFCIDFHQ